MSESEKMLFLGIDGGQSHTEAVIADENGNILGRGFGGALDHGNLPEGRRRLKTAITESVNNALQKAGLSKIEKIRFASVHCGLTGGADYKDEIIREIIDAEKLVVGHDALTALFGATGGQSGIVVIAGTGSIVFGINEQGKTARAGGLGYIFSDEGSGFWLALETIKFAIKEQDGVISDCGLRDSVLDFFKVGEVRELTNAFYNDNISRDKIASFAETISLKAENGNEFLKNLIKSGADRLVENVKGASKNLEFGNKIFKVSAVGGMFQSRLMKSFFVEILKEKIPNAEYCEPKFPPPIGALFLAYLNSSIEINERILTNLENSYVSKI